MAAVDATGLEARHVGAHFGLRRAAGPGRWQRAWPKLTVVITGRSDSQVGGGAGVLERPDVVACQRSVLPTERGDMAEQARVDLVAGLAQRVAKPISARAARHLCDDGQGSRFGDLRAPAPPKNDAAVNSGASLNSYAAHAACRLLRGISARTHRASHHQRDEQ